MAVTTQTVRALPYHIPAVWSPTTAYNIAADFAYLLGQVANLDTIIQSVTTTTIINNTGAGRASVPYFPEFIPDDAGEGPWLPGPQGPMGPQGPTGPAGSGTGGGMALPFVPEYAPDDSPDLLIPMVTGPQGPQGPAGTPGSGGGAGMIQPYHEEYAPDDSPDLPMLPGMLTAAGIPPAPAVVSWGTPTILALDADFTFATDGLVVLYNTVSQGGTFKINTVVIGGVATNQSSTCGFPYSAGQTGHVVSGGAGTGLTAAFYPFTGGCGWGAPVSLTTSVNFTQTASGLVLIYNSNNQASTYVMGGTTYAETAVDANDSVGVPYIAGQTAQVTAGGAGAGLVAHFYPFTGNGAWAAAVSLSTGVNFTETASGLIVQYNGGNQGSTLTLNGAAVGGVFNTGHHAANNPYTVGQTANIGLVGGAGFLAWFFALPSAAGSGGTIVTGGNFSSNVASSVVGTPVVFGDTSGKLGTSTTNRLVLTGSGHPQGILAAALGNLYADTVTGYTYLKMGGASTAYGWYRLPMIGAGIAAGLLYWSAVIQPLTAASFGRSVAVGALGNDVTAGVFFTPGGVSSSAFTTVSSKRYVTGTCAATTGTTMALTSGAGTAALPMLDDDIDLTLEFLTGSDITNIRLWMGLTSAGITDAQGDTPGSASTGGAIMFRFSTTAGDGGWVGYTAAGGGGATHASATVAAIAASTAYKLRLRFVRQGTPTVYFSVNDGTEVAMTANLPATGALYLLTVAATTKANVAKTFGWRSWGATVGS